jgi:glycosyltransferase involved in cell wall biosynthesis
MKNLQPFVSVLIPSFNRHELLIDTLKGILIQDYKPKEIIVYDQSIDHPPHVQNFLARVSPKINYYKDAPRGLVFAYRRCVELSQGDICFFVDDDVLIDDPDLVTRHVKNYANRLIGAVSGQIMHEGQTAPRPIDGRLYGPHGWRFTRFDISQRLEELPSLSGANMSFRRSVYDRLGGFDQNYEGNGFRFERQWISF